MIHKAATNLGAGQRPATSRELIEHVGATLRRILARIPHAGRYLKPSTALDEAAYLIGLSFGNAPGSGFDAALPSIMEQNAAGLEALYLRLGELIKERFRHAQVDWAFARHLDPGDWEMNRAVAELLLRRLSGAMPEGSPPLRPEMFVDCIPDLFARVQEIENAPLSVLLNRLPQDP